VLLTPDLFPLDILFIVIRMAMMMSGWIRMVVIDGVEICFWLKEGLTVIRI